VLKKYHAPELSEENSHARLQPCTKVAEKNATSDVNIFFHLQKHTVATQKNPQNYRLYAHPLTKKKDVATKRLLTLSVFSH